MVTGTQPGCLFEPDTDIRINWPRCFGGGAFLWRICYEAAIVVTGTRIGAYVYFPMHTWPRCFGGGAFLWRGCLEAAIVVTGTRPGAFGECKRT